MFLRALQNLPWKNTASGFQPLISSRNETNFKSVVVTLPVLLRTVPSNTEVFLCGL